MKKYKDLSKKKDFVCYLIETDEKNYLEFVEKKDVRTAINKWKKNRY